MSQDFASVTCPSCFQVFEVAVPDIGSLPTELDYDCEICCRPMFIQIDMDGDEVYADARGIND